MEISLSKLLSIFLYLISLLSFSVGFYELIFKSDVTSATLAFLVAFLSIVFANYRDLETVSALGFSARFKKIESDAEALLSQLKLQSAFMIDEIIFAILQTNLLSSEKSIWVRLNDLRKNLTTYANVAFTEQQMKDIRSQFIFEFISYRFFRINRVLVEQINDKLYNYEMEHFVRPIQNELALREFMYQRNEILNSLPFGRINKVSDCEDITISKITDQMDTIKDKLKTYNIDLEVSQEYLDAIRDLNKILESSDILSEDNIEMISRAFNSRNDSF